MSTMSTHYATTDREARDALLVDACLGRADAACMAALADSNGDPEIVAVWAARCIYVNRSDDDDADCMPHGDVHAAVLATLCLYPQHRLLSLLDGLLSQAARDDSLIEGWRRTCIQPLAGGVRVCSTCRAKYIPMRGTEHAACKVGM